MKKHEEEEEERKRREKQDKNLVFHINRLCKSNRDVNTLNLWKAEVVEKQLSPEEEVAFVQEKLDQLSKSSTSIKK